MMPLAFNASTFSTSRKNLYLVRTLENGLDQRSGRSDHVLAIVEDYEHVLVPEEPDQVPNGIVDRNGKAYSRGKRVWYPGRIRNCTQFYKGCAVCVPFDQLTAHFQRESAFSYSAGPH